MYKWIFANYVIAENPEFRAAPSKEHERTENRQFLKSLKKKLNNERETMESRMRNHSKLCLHP